MARAKKPVEEYSLISIKIRDHKARVGARYRKHKAPHLKKPAVLMAFSAVNGERFVQVEILFRRFLGDHALLQLVSRFRSGKQQQVA